MKRLAIAAAITAAVTGQACAQTATGIGVGTGVGIATSRSSSTAIGGGNARGGNANATGGNASAQGGRGGNARAVSTGSTAVLSQSTPANQSITNVPTAFAPGLTAAGLETCLGSVSGGGSWLGTGISLGGTIPDPGCATRLDARTLWSMGLKKAAVARLCLNPDIYRSMPEVCTVYLPGTIPIAAPLPSVGLVPIATPAAYSEPYVAGTDIWLIDGRTGLNRLCKNYDSARQRCRVWDGAVMHHVSATRNRPLRSDKIPTTTAAVSNEDHSK